MHFSEILKLQYGKKRHTLLCILLFFSFLIIVAFNHAFLRDNFPNFWIPIALAKACFSHIVKKGAKILLY